MTERDQTDQSSATVTGTGVKPFGLGLDHRSEVYVGDGAVYRELSDFCQPFYVDLVNSQVFQDTVDAGHVLATRVAASPLTGGDCLVQELISPICFPFEWSAGMYKASAISTLKLNIQLMANGYCTQDGHPWNIVFEDAQPRFVDITSIVPLPENGKWLGVEEFEKTFLNTLLLMEKGYTTVARKLSVGVRDGVDRELAHGAMRSACIYPKDLGRLSLSICRARDVLAHFWHKVVNRIAKRNQGMLGGRLADMERLLRFVEATSVDPVSDNWSAYYASGKDYPVYNGRLEEVDAAIASTEKHRAVDAILAKHRPGRVLDIGCNRGVYCQIACRHGCKAIGIDTDELALHQMYEDTRRNGVGGTPFYVNAFSPAEPVGLANRGFPPAPERLRADCVLCLAVMHHVVLKSPYLTFEHLVEILGSYTEEHLIVEFVPLEDAYVQEHMLKHHVKQDRFPWYTLEGFTEALGKQFDTVTPYPSHPESRTILHCSGKRA